MHTMQLRSPWQVDRGDGVFQRCELPDVDASSADRVTYRRSFNRPTGLDSFSKVWLFIRAWEGRLESVSINEQPIHLVDRQSPIQLNITDSLLRSNRIEVVVVAETDGRPCLVGPVELGIE